MYPDFMSRYVDWPDNALDGTPILAKHDLEMTELMFRPNERSVQDQRRRKRRAPLSMACNSAVTELSFVVISCSKPNKAAVDLAGSE